MNIQNLAKQILTEQFLKLQEKMLINQHGNSMLKNLWKNNGEIILRTEDELDNIMANLDFKKGKPVSEVLALAKLQAKRKTEQAKHAEQSIPNP